MFIIEVFHQADIAKDSYSVSTFLLFHRRSASIGHLQAVVGGGITRNIRFCYAFSMPALKMVLYGVQVRGKREE